MSVDARLLDIARMSAPRFDRYHLGDEVLLGVSALVDDPQRPRIGHVVLSGELCPATAETVADMLDGLITDGVVEIHVDLSKLDFCMSRGIDVLEHARRRVERRDGSLQLLGARGIVRRTLEVTGVRADHPSDHPA